jgi:hypothetical protein
VFCFGCAEQFCLRVACITEDFFGVVEIADRRVTVNALDGCLLVQVFFLKEQYVIESTMLFIYSRPSNQKCTYYNKINKITK